MPMISSKIKDALREAITNHIPFEIPQNIDYAFLLYVVSDLAAELKYVKAAPSKFKDKAWTFHIDPEKGLRWGYVQNGQDAGWLEGRETIPLPERVHVIKDSDVIYGHQVDLVDSSDF